MAKPKNELDSLFNPVSLSMLAILLLVLDIVVKQMWGNPVETLTIDFSGILFGLSLGYLLLGKRRYNHSLGVWLAFVYVAFFFIGYLSKLIAV